MANNEYAKLVIHYSGSFLRDTIKKTQKYVGGWVHFVVIERDRCCYIDLVDEVVSYTKIPKENMIIRYKYPDIPLFEAMGKVESDEDLLYLLELKKGENVEFDLFLTTREDVDSEGHGRIDKKKEKASKREKASKKKKTTTGPKVRHARAYGSEHVEEQQVREERQQAMEEGLPEVCEEDQQAMEEGPVEVEEKDYLSDYQEDDLNYESDESFDAERASKRVNNKGSLFDDHHGIGRVDLFVGLEFKDIESCRKVIRQYAIDNHFNLILAKNEKRRVIGRCTADDCPWRCYAACMQDSVGYIIRKLEDKHTCASSQGRGERSVTQEWIATKIKEQIRTNPKQTIKSIKSDLQREYGIGLHYHKIWRGKNDAMDNVFGRHEESFKLVPSLCATLQKTNVGTIADYRLSPEGRFERLFVCMTAWKLGFLRACRPYIGLDGCFLKGKYKGILLSAISLDAENGIFPLAIAVVQAENTDSWLWFLGLLRGALSYCTYTFMSDRQKGLIDAIQRIFPDCPHHYCVRHLYANLKTMHFGRGVLLRDTFWAAARAYTMPHYEQHMQLISQFAPEAYTWISQISGNNWSRAFFSDEVPCSQIENNASESWNNFVGDLRCAAICEMVDELRRKMMERFQKRREKSASWRQKVVPRVVKQIEDTMAEARCAELIYAGEDEYEIQGRDDRHTVFITKRTCTCRRWQVDGIPCKHALAVCIERRDDPYDYCNRYLTVDAYRATYEQLIHSMPDRSLWEKVDGETILPPNVKRAPGRPKKQRRRAADETPSQGPRPSHGQTVRCSQCKALGHNRKTCKSGQGTSSSRARPRSGKLPVSKRGRGRGIVMGGGSSHSMADR